MKPEIRKREKTANKTTEKLLPCPFCGADPKIGSLGGDEENWMIYCPCCQIASAEMGVGSIETKDDCIKGWNTRVQCNSKNEEKVITLWYKLTNNSWVYNHYTDGWDKNTRPFRATNKGNEGRWSKEIAYMNKGKVISYFKA